MSSRHLRLLTLIALLDGPALSAGPSSGPAIESIYLLASENRSAFFVYRNSDDGLNHGFPSGWFVGGGASLAQIHLDTACVYDPTAPTRCATDKTRLDRVRGTVMKVSFDSIGPGQFAGINIEEPENYGTRLSGRGYDLRGATRVCFDALSPTPALRVQFEVDRKKSAFMAFSNSWTSTCINFTDLTASPNLSDVHYLFTVVTNDLNAPMGGTILLDNIRFEPVPTAQANALSFPRANNLFGVIPVAAVQPGRVEIPPDQVLGNLTTVYESALALFALLSTGDDRHAGGARIIADTLVYALAHDNEGLPLPTSGSDAGVRTGYMDGEIALFNDQGPGAGRQGQVRLAGFSVASSMCGPSRFCLVLDGATGGNNAFAILALVAAFDKFGDSRYLTSARKIGNWLHTRLADNTGTGFGGYYLGYPDEGANKNLLMGKSIENNADIFRAFTALSQRIRRQGFTDEAFEWDRRAAIAGDFVIQMFDSVNGRFHAGTVPVGTAPAPGILPNGGVRGNDIINTFDFLDAQTFTTLTMADSPRYRNSIDWRRPIQWMVDHFDQTVVASGISFQGFNLVTSPSSGPNGIAWEFTAQAAVAMRFVDELYGESRFSQRAPLVIAEMEKARTLAPFSDGVGLVAATIQDGELLPPYEQCLSTPFQCIASRIGLAATAWAVFAELNRNPFQSGAVHGDLDTNGRPDLIWQDDATRRVAAWYMGAAKGNEFVSFGWLHPVGVPGWSIVAVGDTDGNGKPDLIWQNDATRQVVVWHMGGPKGDQYQSYAWLQSSNTPGWSVVGLGDLDGNGKPDLIWQHDGTRQVAAWYMGGALGNEFQSFNWLQSSNTPGWSVAGTADLDGNGKPDLIWQNDTTRQVVVWYMGGSNGSQYQSFAWLQNSITPGWKVVGLVDLDGNGKPDLLWQNDSTRQVAVWYMGGAMGNQFQSFAWLESNGIPGWRAMSAH